MADGGQVYVKVEADTTSAYSTRSIGSNGETTLSFTIKWSFNGGITGQYGWDSPRPVAYVEGDVEATNAAVARAYQGATIAELYAIMSCVE